MEKRGPANPPVLPIFVLRSLIFAMCVLAGCGTPGEPRPPRPEVPAAVTDLAVRQVGEGVELRFTLPQMNVEGEKLSEPPAVEIYRGRRTRGEASVKASLVYTIPGALVDTYLEQGRVRFADPVAREDWEKLVGQELIYAVKTRASRRAASAFSTAVALALHAPAEAVGEIRVSVTEIAIELTWAPVTRTTLGKPLPGLAGYRVYRAEAEAVPEQGTPDAAKLGLKLPLELLGLTPTTSFRDAQFEFGRHYVYVVRSVAQYDAEEVESADSAPARVTPQDRFAPAAPQGLVVVLVLPAEPAARPPTEQKAYLELSWQISPETDVAGYHVYRSEETEGSGAQRRARVNAELLLTPTFRDMSVLPGRRYAYAVTAVDRAGNESLPSTTVTETVPRPER